MGMGPFNTYQLPSASPSGTQISKTDKGYAIAWLGGEVWGDPHIEGSPREIARDIIIRYGKVLDLPTPSYTMDMENISWYGAIRVKWKPELIVSLNDRLHILENVDSQLFISELTKELQPLAKLIPFI